MKKFIAGLLTAALASGILTGCGEKPETVGEYEKSYSYWVEMPSALVSQYQSLSQVSMYQELEKQTGVQIEFIHPPAGQAAEQFNLMIASKELPDMIEYAWGSYQGGPDKAINDNIIIKLNELIETNAPNFKKVMDGNSDYAKQSRTDTGMLYGFPSINEGKYRVFGGLIIRKDWLDELNLPVPETLDEWETTLRAFKEKKGAKAPITFSSDAFTNPSTNHFNNAFDVGIGMYVEDGKVKLAQIEPAYKDFIALMHRWYDEGLIDSEYSTNNATVVDAKMTNGTSGATFGYIGGTIGRYMAAMKEKDPSYNLVGAQYPVMKKGDQPKFMERQNEVSNPFLAVTSVCKNPVEAVEWIDYLYSEAGRELKNFGVEGLTYKREGDSHVYTDEILNNPEGLSVSEAMARHFRANAPAPGFSQAEEYLMQYYQLDAQKEALDTWSLYADNAAKTVMPSITPLAEEAEELTSISTEISTYTAEMVVKFIKGDEPMDRFDQFVQTLKEMGAERIIELNQAAYERFNAR